MRPRVLTALALLAGVAGAAAYAQPQRSAPAVPNGPYTPAPAAQPPSFTPIPSNPPPLATQQRAAVPAVPLAEVPFDDLLGQLEALKAQKAELAKHEGDVVKEVRRRMEKHAETLRRLGYNPEVVPGNYGTEGGSSPLPPTSGPRGKTGGDPYSPEDRVPSTAPAPRRKTGTLPAPEPVPEIPVDYEQVQPPAPKR
jgi:hypothetical protein